MCLDLYSHVFEQNHCFFGYAKILVFLSLTSQMMPEIHHNYLKNAPQKNFLTMS